MNRMFSTSILWIIPSIFVIGSVFYNVVAFASLGPIGGQLYTMTIKKEHQLQKNADLSAQLAIATSLQRTAQLAEQRGYVPISRITQVELTDTKVALSTTP